MGRQTAGLSLTWAERDHRCGHLGHQSYIIASRGEHGFDAAGWILAPTELIE
jgi:hypothetical protein